MIHIQPAQPQEKEPPVLLYIGPERHARFTALAAAYNMRLVDLFDKVLEALEANEAERGNGRPDETTQD